MKIAFVDTGDPTNTLSWSGIPSRMIEGFAVHSQVMVVGRLGAGLDPLYLGHKVMYGLTGRRFDQHRTRLLLEIYSSRLRRALASHPVDAIVAPGSLPIAHLNSGVPTMFWTDACFGAMLNYYDDFTSLCERSRRDGEAQERAALRRCDLAVYASDWAAEECRSLYPEHADKVRVVPFGANFDPGLHEPAAEALVRARSRDHCHLLFVGIDWKRKGGEIALEACRIMNAAGIRTTLTVVGCRPFGNDDPPPNVEVPGFLSRAAPRDRERLAALFRRSHFLVLPSVAEAFGIVLCEAAAFAVPSLATRTGGIATIVDDGASGCLVPPHADGRAVAESLRALFEDRSRYHALAMAAFHKYRTRLNWTVACKSVLELLKSRD